MFGIPLAHKLHDSRVICESFRGRELKKSNLNTPVVEVILYNTSSKFNSEFTPEN